VGLFVAGIGLCLGVIPRDIFSVAVLMSIATTLVVPPALVAIYRRSPERGASSIISRDVSEEFALGDDGPAPRRSVEAGP
jgi:hypothetical protein